MSQNFPHPSVVAYSFMFTYVQGGHREGAMTRQRGRMEMGMWGHREGGMHRQPGVDSGGREFQKSGDLEGKFK